MIIEMSMKVLSGNWDSHEVAKMYQTITTNTYPNKALMASLEEAIKSQKYLLSPSAGIIEHVPELEELFEFLYRRITPLYPGFHINAKQDLPDNLAQFLLTNIKRYYRCEPGTLPPNRSVEEATQVHVRSVADEIERVRITLSDYLKSGQKWKIQEMQSKSLMADQVKGLI